MNPNFQDFAALRSLMFQPTAGQVYADVSGELAILDSNQGIYYGLDPVGARIWSLILEFKTAAEIRSILLEEYDVEAFQLDCDITQLLTELFSKGLIEVANEQDKARHVHESAHGSWLSR